MNPPLLVQCICQFIAMALHYAGGAGPNDDLMLGLISLSTLNVLLLLMRERTL